MTRINIFSVAMAAVLVAGSNSAYASNLRPRAGDERDLQGWRRKEDGQRKKITQHERCVSFIEALQGPLQESAVALTAHAEETELAPPIVVENVAAEVEYSDPPPIGEVADETLLPAAEAAPEAARNVTAKLEEAGYVPKGSSEVVAKHISITLTCMQKTFCTSTNSLMFLSSLPTLTTFGKVLIDTVNSCLDADVDQHAYEECVQEGAEEGFAEAKSPQSLLLGSSVASQGNAQKDEFIECYSNALGSDESNE